MQGFIYLIREREFFRIKENTYKVGKTQNEPNTRLQGYPKGSEVCVFIQTLDQDILEINIIDKFKGLFIQKKEYGNEYFEGDCDLMIKIIHDTIYDYKENIKKQINENKQDNNINITIKSNPNYDEIDSNDKIFKDDFDTMRMTNLLEEDLKFYENKYKSYYCNMEKTNSFKYFSHFHFFIEKGNIYFKKKHNDSIMMIDKLDNIENTYECLRVNNNNFITDWKKSKCMPRYKHIDFIPHLDTNISSNRVFNLFMGFKYYKKNHEYDAERVKVFTDYIKYLCSNDGVISNYLINWIAHIIQNPSNKTNVAIIFHSQIGGIGKKALIELLTKLFTGYIERLSDIESINRKLNFEMFGKLLLIGDEIKACASNLMNDLKNVITQKEMRIEYKGKEPFIINSYNNFIFTTDDEFILKSTTNDKRFILIECPTIIKNQDYFDRFFDILKNETYLDDFFAYLLTLDIKNFNAQMVPITDSKKRNIINRLPLYIQMIRENYELYQDKEYNAEQLYLYSLNYAKEMNLQATYSKTSFYRNFKKYFGKYSIRRAVGVFYNFPHNFNINVIDKLIFGQ